MVPVSAFAAVVAMAGPQRFAAESTMQDAADDLAMFAVAWREGHNTPSGHLRAFPPECAARTDQENADLAALAGSIALLDPDDADFLVDLAEQQRLLNAQRMEFRMEQLLFPAPDPADLAAAKDELDERLNHPVDGLVALLNGWEEACRALSDALVRDLGYLGVDVGSLRGFYSDSLTESAMTGVCTNLLYTTQAACTGASETWTPRPRVCAAVPDHRRDLGAGRCGCARRSACGVDGPLAGRGLGRGAGVA